MDEQQVILTLNPNNETSVIVQNAKVIVARENGNISQFSHKGATDDQLLLVKNKFY